MSDQPPAKAAPPLDSVFLRMHSAKLIGILVWGTLIGVYLYYANSQNLTLGEALRQLATLLSSSYGPLLYILIFACTPFVFFFSAAALAVLGGAIFGAGSLFNLLLAILYTIVGSLSAGMIAYALGRWLGSGILPENEGFVSRYAERIRQNGFETILIMHAIFLPYELVNYIAGILRVNPMAFLIATFLGSLPGLLAFVSFGAALDLQQVIAGEMPHIDLRLILFSILVFILSLLGARYLRHYM